VNLRRLDCLSSYHWRNFTLKSGGDQWRREDLVSGGTTIEAPSGVGYGEGCPLPSGLGGLGERHELPQHFFQILGHRTLPVARKIRFSCPKYKEKILLQIPL